MCGLWARRLSSRASPSVNRTGLPPQLSSARSRSKAQSPSDKAPAEAPFGALRFDSGRMLLLRGEDAIRLTTAESTLLGLLAERPGTVLSRETLTEKVGIAGGVRAVDVQVTRLRRKIEPDPKLPRYLQTVRGRGYVLRPD